jgi:hypothetical protein
MGAGNSNDIVEFTFDHPRRKLLYDIPGQIELEEKTGLGMLELSTKVTFSVSPKLIKIALWVGMKHAGEKVPSLKEFDTLYEKARLQTYEYIEKGETKVGHVNNAYLGEQILKALNRAGAVGEPADDEGATTTDDQAGTEDRDAGPTRAASPSS